MTAPTSSDLGDLLGREVNGEQGEAVIAIASALTRSYTRGNGFTDGVPADDVRAVIVTRALRMLTDPAEAVESERMGPFATTYRPHDGGWTMGELTVLNRYRERAR